MQGLVRCNAFGAAVFTTPLAAAIRTGCMTTIADRITERNRVRGEDKLWDAMLMSAERM